ncbi:hypothetical protein RRG08_016781 [Elysia crispata]|uniref:Uncharacterized protein n=1 Tax=Elysia crispata TaxID=231223 RepID=A0AAE1A158_9GAST|nr:hypothetical protein RRG08_016781 [Elysia crispata]
MHCLVTSYNVLQGNEAIKVSGRWSVVRGGQHPSQMDGWLSNSPASRQDSDIPVIKPVIHGLGQEDGQTCPLLTETQVVGRRRCTVGGTALVMIWVYDLGFDAPQHGAQGKKRNPRTILLDQGLEKDQNRATKFTGLTMGKNDDFKTDRSKLQKRKQPCGSENAF